MNLCRDCRYFISNVLDSKRFGFYPIYCTEPAKIYSVIDGTPKNRSDFILCEEYRAEVSHIGNKCGPEGKHFKDKD